MHLQPVRIFLWHDYKMNSLHYKFTAMTVVVALCAVFVLRRPLAADAEAFVDGGSSPPAPPTSAPLPATESLVLHLSTLLDERSYIVANHTWKNAVDLEAVAENAMVATGTQLNDPFRLNVEQRRLGLNMNDTLLSGYSSLELGVMGTGRNRTLPSTTIAWFAKWDEAPQPPTRVSLWKMHAETPNRVELYMESADDAHVNIRVLFGHMSKIYGEGGQWSVSKSDLVTTNGSPVLCTFVVDRSTTPHPTLAFYVGGVRVGQAIQIDEDPAIQLGPSPVDINGTRAWKAHLLAVGMWRTAFNAGTIAALQSHWMKSYHRAYDIEERMRELQKQSDARIGEMRAARSNLQKALQTCVATSAAQSTAPNERRWQVKPPADVRNATPAAARSAAAAAAPAAAASGAAAGPPATPPPNTGATGVPKVSYPALARTAKIT